MKKFIGLVLLQILALATVSSQTVLLCPDDINVPLIDLDFSYNYGEPTVNLNQAFTLDLEQSSEQYICGLDLLEKVSKLWILNYNNQTDSCTQIINVIRSDIDQYSPPPDTTISGNVPVSVHPDVTGYFGPNFNYVDNINSSYSDSLIYESPTLDKIRRSWTLQDLCTGEIIMHEQLINVNKYLPGTCIDTVGFNVVQDPNSLDTIRMNFEVERFVNINYFYIPILFNDNAFEYVGIESHQNVPFEFDGQSNSGYGTVIFPTFNIDYNIDDGDVAFSLLFLPKINTVDSIFVFVENGYEIGGANDYRCVEPTGGVISSNRVYIHGSVYYDQNEDCNIDPSENKLSGWMLEFDNGQDVYNGITDNSGNYNKLLSEGKYTIRAFPPNSLWGLCAAEMESPDLQLGDNFQADFLAQADLSCPKMQVEIINRRLRRCFNSEYHLRYTNKGTGLAQDAYVEIDLDPGIIFIETEFLDYELNGNVLRFNLGDVEAQDLGYISFTVKTECNIQLGTTLCVNAIAYPNFSCKPNGSWSGASIAVDAECEGDNIRFNIANVGTGNMTSKKQFIIIEDDVMTPPRDFELNAGSNIEFNIASRGATFRLVAEQENNHPDNSNPTIAVEACGLNAEGEVSRGFINIFPEAEETYSDKFCTEVIGSFDPNDKQALPKGLGEKQLLKANTDLEYIIRFQNTGTDTAFRVVLKDNISSTLNLKSLSSGVASHPYTLSIEDQRTAVFTFDNIQLVDDKTNEPGSHGFIKFRISQNDDLAEGTLIKNKAEIYFDFNEAIITNEQSHEIGSDFLVEQDIDQDEDGSPLFEDCDDNNAEVNPNASEQVYNGIDDDCNALTLDDDLDGDGFVLADDCDDTNSDVNPAVVEVEYNGIDDDCNALTLDDDLDGDGFVLADDCDDTNTDINPAVAEVAYNGIDDDCNALTLDDDLDGDGFVLADDCDDTNPEINSAVAEVAYNGIDDDCNALTLDDDLDGDGFVLADDCDDTNADINPAVAEVAYNGIDDDCDALTLDDDLDGDGFVLADDCNDTNPDINPAIAEVAYNGIDDDCNALTLDDDLDGDGFVLADDCDDTNSDINPAVSEVAYNGIDDDCNALTLDDDLDGDGFVLADDCDDTNSDINPAIAEVAYNGMDDDCDALTLDDDLDGDGFVLADDCDDTNPEINSAVAEVAYNGIDDDCNPATRDDDIDGDEFILADDCDDTNAEVNPNMSEIAYNGLDDDCDDLTPDDDLDGDGFDLADDCDDTNSEINPDGIDIPNNGIDEDCDGADLIVSATDTPFEEAFKIFPNPTRDNLYIKNLSSSDYKLKLYDFSGQMILIENSVEKINFKNLQEGMYFLRIYNSEESKTFVKKIIVFK